MSPLGFVHLHNHTEYSLADGISRIKGLMAAAKADGQVALALTDQSNMMAMVKFYSAARAAGIKPILGADLWVRKDGQISRITALCQNHEGFLNLSWLISESYLKDQSLEKPLVTWEKLVQKSPGLVILNGAKDGELGITLAQKTAEDAQQVLQQWLDVFAQRYVIELVRTGREGEEDYIQSVLPLAEKFSVPLVATNDTRFLSPEDFLAHEVRVAIHEGYVLEDPKRPKNYSEQQYFRSQGEMQQIFADIPQAIENSLLIAQSCNLELTLGQNFLPDFPVPAGMTMDSFFRATCHRGLDERLAVILRHATAEEKAEREPIYRERLDFELNTILQMDFPGYFLIVADFIQWAKNHDIPVGPGRGSGAGSLVAYALKITDLDPLAYDLLFERFLNPERVSMPDFDVDFCMDRRDEVIDYVSHHYGRENVSQIITYGTMAAKAVVRDVGRVLGMPYGQVDRISKWIPNDLGMTLTKALEESADLKEAYAQDEEVRDLIDLGLALEGVARNAGKHAGGVVIGPRPLYTFCPMYSDELGQNVVTQLDKNDVEAAGLVKFDFLGLRTLTIIDWAVKAIKADSRLPNDLDISLLPTDDASTYELIKTGYTTGVFQLESSGMQELIRKLKPDCFEDIIALVALYRPGPLGSGMVDDFIARKHGIQKVEYPHSCLIDILKPTYGTVLYQEQVMQIAQVMANYTLGGADMLRRAMGKKKPEEMAKQREVFMAGAAQNHIDPQIAKGVFDVMEKFAEYGFNKSHSAAYALVSYQTAWLKKHYPAPFMAAVMSADMDNTDKVVHLTKEVKRMGLKLSAPDINRSLVHFHHEDHNTLRYGLGAIKGAGAAALGGLVQERLTQGHYVDFSDFMLRAGKGLNKKVLEALILSGALDTLHPNRKELLDNISLAFSFLAQVSSAQEAGQNDLFASADDSQQMLVLQATADFSPLERLFGEQTTLGQFFSGHPYSLFAKQIKPLVSHGLDQVSKSRDKEKITLAGFCEEVIAKRTNAGAKMLILVLTDDADHRLEITLFPEMAEKYQSQVAKDQILIIKGTPTYDKYREEHKLSAEEIWTLPQAQMQQRLKKYSLVRKTFGPQSREQDIQHWLHQARSRLEEHGLPLEVEIQGENYTCQLSHQAYHIPPDDDTLNQLELTLVP